MVEIDVYSNSGGASILSKGADYRISVKWGKWNDGDDTYPRFTMNVNKVLQTNHYVALMRYKERAHNGGSLDGEHRPKMNKWFAFYYSNPDRGEIPIGHRGYDNGSILKAHAVNFDDGNVTHMPASDGYFSYELKGVLNDNTEVDFREALLYRFTEYDSDSDSLRIKLDYNRDEDIFNFRGSYQDPDDYYQNINMYMRCFYNCGVGIVDSHGTLLSNIVPLKILFRSAYVDANNQVIAVDLGDILDVAELMLIYPQVKQRVR